MTVPTRYPWLFRIVPATDESFSHYLGRFRRANQLSRQTLADLLFEGSGDRPASLQPRCDRASSGQAKRSRILITAWETPSRRCQPTEAQLDQLAQLMQLHTQQLRQALFPPTWPLYPTTRLCPACYQAEPIHRLSWQRADSTDCPVHHRPFLTQCPACQTALRIPSLWEIACCERCWLSFAQMGAEDWTTSEPEEA